MIPCRGRGQGRGHRRAGDGTAPGVSSSSRATSWRKRVPQPRLKALLREGGADVVLSDMAAQGTGHSRTDHLRIMGAGRKRPPNLPSKCWRRVGRWCAKLFQGGADADTAGAAQARLSRPSGMSSRPRAGKDSSERYVSGDGVSRRSPSSVSGRARWRSRGRLSLLGVGLASGIGNHHHAPPRHLMAGIGGHPDRSNRPTSPRCTETTRKPGPKSAAVSSVL